jgi:hypothetical protein
MVWIGHQSYNLAAHKAIPLRKGDCLQRFATLQGLEGS